MLRAGKEGYRQSAGDPATEETPNSSLYELALWLAVRQTPPRNLAHGAKLCWDVIARWERSDKECWSGLLRMGHELGVTESQASRYIAELIKKGYAERTMGTKGRPIYKRLIPPDLAAQAEKLLQELQAKKVQTRRD
jgi:hypothetical protein